MKLPKMKSRELFDLCIVLIAAAILSIFSMSIHSIGKLYSFFNAYTDLPLAEFLINVCFLSLIGLLWITYIRWKKAAKRQAELENIISSISPDVLLVVDSNRTIIECNSSLKRMFGYEVDEVIKHKTDFIYFDRRSNPKTRHEIHQRLERNGFHIGSATGKKKNGERIPLEIITGNLSGRGGAVLLLRDITERKRTEEALISTEREKAIILESLSEHVVYQDNQMRILWANRAASDSVGLAPDQLIGRHCYEIWHQRNEPCIGCPVFKVRQTGQPQEAEMVTPDGRAWFIRGYPVRDANGDPVGVVEVTMEITERKRTDEALQESEKRLRQFATAVTDVIYRYDPKNNRYDFISPSFEYQTRYPLEEVKADPYGLTRRITHPEDVERVFSQVDEHIKKGPGAGPFSTEYRVIRKDGKVIWVSDRKDIEFTPDGEVYRINGIVRDTTERKRAEKALKEAEERNRDLYENANDLIQSVDVNGKFVYVNNKWKQVMGYTDEEVKNLNLIDILRKDLVPYCMELFEKVVAGETLDSVEAVFITKEGKEICVSGSVNPRMKDGKFVATRGIFRDITEGKRAEEILQESEEKYSKLFHNSNDAIFLHDLEGKIIDVNQKVLDLFGYTKNEILSVKIPDLHPPEALEKSRWAFETISKDGFVNFEIEFKKKNGEIFLAEVSSSLFRVGQKKVIQGIVRDVTERKRMEENLRKSKEEAEEANRLKSEFLANMSHEIRTPMNAIIGLTDITLQTCLTDEQRDYLVTVKDSARALLQLLDDILDLSKIEAGRSELENIDFDLRATIEGLADTLAHRASVKGLELAFMIHHHAPTFLQGDPGRLRQILMNLAGNAIKFTEKGEVVIQAELSEETEDRATLLFSVTDTGVGIPRDKQEKIFESFTQVDGTTTRKYGGTGLGLSISRRLVELLGGQIGVESQPGKGSRFWFTATFKKQKELKDNFPLIPPDIRGMRMLVVDDNKTNRTVLVKMLESFGCSPEAVESGNEAIRILKRAAHKEKLFDLVLLDMQMPEMGGEETLRAIKDDPEIKDVVVIILTSIGERGDASRLEALGCAGYILKPIKQSQLFDTILTVLGRQKTKVKGKPCTIVTRHTIAEQKRRRVRILLAEDNPMNQKLAVALLRKAGFSVDAVENGKMAIEAIGRTAYDLVFMDVQMPVMDGFEASQAIREREGEKKHTPIIAMTAHAMKGDRERCLQAGMDDYISKPIEPQELIGTIEKWIKSSERKKAISGEDKPKKVDHLKDIPIDIETALLRFDGDKEFFEEVLQEFLDHAPKQLQMLDEAANKGDGMAVEREAHSIKGAAGNLGAKGIADLALKLELLGRTGDLVGAKETILNLRNEFKHLKRYINKSLLPEVALKS